jgi:large subunit ribosomal protein LX
MSAKAEKKGKNGKEVKSEKQKKEKTIIKEKKVKIQKTDKHEKKKMNVFKVIGSYKKGKVVQKFTKEILTPNKQQAEEYVYSIMGSKHRLKRREIIIDSIEQIGPDQVTDMIIRQMLEAN